jgi:type IV secretion system protein VirB1
MPILTLPAVLHLAADHAPAVAPETVATFAQAESRLDPLAVHDNTTGRSHAPRTVAEAVVLARTLLAKGHSLDLGLLQINDANLSRTGLTVESAFDPDLSVEAGGQILVAAWQRCRPGRGEADALRCMASVYNSGREQAGIRSGYVARVWRVAERIVPAIRQAVPPRPLAPAPQAPEPPGRCGPSPPSWDAWALADHRRCVQREAPKPTKE